MNKYLDELEGDIYELNIWAGHVQNSFDNVETAFEEMESKLEDIDLVVDDEDLTVDEKLSEIRKILAR